MSKLFRSPTRSAGAEADPTLPVRAHLIAGLFYPFWYLLIPVDARDAWWTWGGVSLVFLGSAGLASQWNWLRCQLRDMFPGPWLSTLQMYVLAWLNNMHIFYTVGCAMAVLAISASIASTAGLARYGFFVSGLGLILYILDPDPVKVACWGGLLPVIAIAYQRLSVTLAHERLAENYRSQLERDVTQQTHELSETNRRLRSEMEERARLEEELRLASKLEAVGRLAGGVAHEFNNLLTRIRLYADLALQSVTARSPVREDIDEIQKAGHQAADLIRQLLTFSRQGPVSQEVVDINGVVESSRSMMQHLLGESRALGIFLGDGPLAVVADRQQLEQVLVNLTLNACDAMPDHGRVTIETTACRRRDPIMSDHAHEIRETEYVLLTFTDTGTGMDSETLARAFDPFFTRKPTHSGSGLGLSIVHGILHQAGGHVSVRSEPGKGARFELYWPRTAEIPSDPPAPTRSRELRGGSERVLLIEDEERLRLALERLLRSVGYNVQSSENAETALGIAVQETGPIHLLLSDVVMPGMSGLELADALRRVHPETRVLLISGYAERGTGSQPDMPSGMTFLAKPFDPGDLMAKIRDVLDAPTRR